VGGSSLPHKKEQPPYRVSAGVIYGPKKGGQKKTASLAGKKKGKKSLFWGLKSKKKKKKNAKRKKKKGVPFASAHWKERKQPCPRQDPTQHGGGENLEGKGRRRCLG